MKKEISAIKPALSIWGTICLLHSIALSILLSGGEGEFGFTFLIATFLTVLATLPVFAALIISLEQLNKKQETLFYKLGKLIFIYLIIAMLYGMGERAILEEIHFNYITSVAFLFLCTIAATALNIKLLLKFFYSSLLINKNNFTMENFPANIQAERQQNSNSILVKGITTGILILVMMIPTFFISNLIDERADRQQSVANEVKAKWAAGQTVSGMYLFVPYTVQTKDEKGKDVLEEKSFLLLPDNLEVTSSVTPEERKRSIYTVLLYKCTVKNTGNFNFKIPENINPASIIYNKIELRLGLSDFKGIDEKVAVTLNNNVYEMIPTHANDFTDLTSGSNKSFNRNQTTDTADNVTVLASVVNLLQDDINKTLSFTGQLKLKGSDELHFLPMAGTSKFTIESAWSNPSFDGNTLPTERSVTKDGFNATWVFNKANLPFGATINNFSKEVSNLAFGVSMIQPGDQYANSSRSIKYAILIIGLTFSLFFVVELLQKKTLHPVQYVLVGLALSIFYTLLLSVSEFLLFDWAYLIAAVATVLLITAYINTRFKSLKTSGLLMSVLSLLYTFIFVLIKLEDTALLVGSIGLFIVLAIVMFVSNKINWGNSSN
ncbi:MAG: cell envelope integrity protein CreD [Chitinophagaceae bacterium]|jgi:inner membrane protein|nr:cell envelope integrity protein CreD [Chitinophagaceae bacterium]